MEEKGRGRKMVEAVQGMYPPFSAPDEKKDDGVDMEKNGVTLAGSKKDGSMMDGMQEKNCMTGEQRKNDELLPPQRLW